MACYFIASALAAIATQSSAHSPTRNEPVGFVGGMPEMPSRDLPLGVGINLGPDELVDIDLHLPGPFYPPGLKKPWCTDCPNPEWQKWNRMYRYNKYAVVSSVRFYIECSEQSQYKQCRSDFVFDGLAHKCVVDKSESRNFECPHEKNERGFVLYKDPHFDGQYHVCWNHDFYQSQRRTCPTGYEFDKIDIHPNGGGCVLRHEVDINIDYIDRR